MFNGWVVAQVHQAEGELTLPGSSSSCTLIIISKAREPSDYEYYTLTTGSGCALSVRSVKSFETRGWSFLHHDGRAWPRLASSQATTGLWGHPT